MPIFTLIPPLLSRIRSAITGMREPGARQKWILLCALLGVAFLAKLFFIFRLSNYSGLLVSDMGFYWQRAHARFQGNYFSPDQWFANPPFFPIFLEEFFKILFFLGLSAHELELTLIFFAALSTFSAGCVYKIVGILTGGFWRAFGAAAFYAFSYPIVYFNAFVLTENLAMPLLIFVLWLVIHREQSAGWMITAGLLFGAAVAIRVALGPIGFFIFLYLWAARPATWQRFKTAIGFSVAFFSVVFLLLVENFFISKGQLRGLAGYFGFNVFLQYCKVRNAYCGSGFYNNPTFLSRHPEFGVFHTNHPFNDRAYFLDLVQGCIRDNPHIWIENLMLFKDVFLYAPWPWANNAWGYSAMPFFCYLTLFLTLSIGLYYWVVPRERLWVSRITLLLSPLLCAMLMCYFFGMEGRLLIPGLFGLYAVFFALIPYFFKMRAKTDSYYAGLLLFFLACAAFGVWQKNVFLNRFGVERIQKAALEKANRRVPDESPGDSWGFFIMPDLQSGILLSSKQPRTAQRIEISTDSFDSYQIIFYFKGAKQGQLLLPAYTASKGGVNKQVLTLPAAMTGRKFDQILVRPVAGDGFYSLAYLILDPVEPDKMQKVYGVSYIQETDLSNLSIRIPDASPGDKYGVTGMPNLQSGVLIFCPAPRQAKTIELSTDSYDSYKMEFFLKEEKKGELLLPVVQPPKGGTYRRTLSMPAAMTGEKFDRILIRPIGGDGHYSLAYLILDPV